MTFQSRRNIWPVYLNLFKQQNRLHGKGSLCDAESLYIGAEVNFISEAWSKSLQIHLLGPAEVEHGSWNGHICSINMCSCFTKGLLVKICIFFFFSSPPSEAQLFILHSFYKRDEYRSKPSCFSRDLIFLTSDLKDQSKTFIKSVQHWHNDLLKWNMVL